MPVHQNKLNGPKGFVLPTLILVTMVLLMLATTLLATGTTSLRVATHDQQSDQALYAAEAGLVRAAAEFAAGGSIPQPYEGDLGGSASSYSVVAYENTGSVDMQVPGGPVIPPSTVYLRSEGHSENGTRRHAGALFTIGLQAFRVGALGNRVEVSDSSFDAYRSTQGDYNPSNLQNDLPLLASNTNSGETFVFNNANVAGDIFVGPGGDPVAQIANTGSTLGNASAMADAIELEAIEVPEEDDDSQGSGAWDVPPIGDLQLIQVDTDGIYHFDDGQGMQFSVDPSDVDPPENAIIGLQPISGTDADGRFVQITIPPGPGHFLLLKENGTAYYNNDVITAPVESEASLESLSRLLFEGISEPSTGSTDIVNPSTLEPGHYDSVTLEDGWNGNLSDNGVYVIKNLNITGNSKLGLPPNAEGATIYVTESMTVDGEDALANETRKPPKMKIFYTGDQPVQLSGGSKSYFTLVAPEADINLNSPYGDAPTLFFGALVGDRVSINNANFHFDTDTSGIGTGTMGSAVSLIHRHRL
jgi:hypothetical protein